MFPTKCVFINIFVVRLEICKGETRSKFIKIRWKLCKVVYSKIIWSIIKFACKWNLFDYVFWIKLDKKNLQNVFGIRIDRIENSSAIGHLLCWLITYSFHQVHFCLSVNHMFLFTLQAPRQNFIGCSTNFFILNHYFMMFILHVRILSRKCLYFSDIPSWLVILICFLYIRQHYVYVGHFVLEKPL